MIQFHILYPTTEGKRFDIRYYYEKHLPMVQEKLGDICVEYSALDGLGGISKDSASPFIAVGRLLLNLESPDEFRKHYMPLADAIRSDIPNFTDIKPLAMICREMNG